MPDLTNIEILRLSAENLQECDHQPLDPTADEAKIALPEFEVDASIVDLVRALNAIGWRTSASCSGHGYRPGNVALRDGREIIIARTYEEARAIDRLFPLDINGEPIAIKGRQSPSEIADIIERLTFIANQVSGTLDEEIEAVCDLAATLISSLSADSERWNALFTLDEWPEELEGAFEQGNRGAAVVAIDSARALAELTRRKSNG